MRGEFIMTGGLAARIVSGVLFGVMTVYFLNKGREKNDVEMLILAAVCGILSAAVFAV